MSAQWLVAPTIVTDNRAEPIQSTDAVPTIRSNQTPEHGGTNAEG